MKKPTKCSQLPQKGKYDYMIFEKRNVGRKYSDYHKPKSKEFKERMKRFEKEKAERDRKRKYKLFSKSDRKNARMISADDATTFRKNQFLTWKRAR